LFIDCLYYTIQNKQSIRKVTKMFRAIYGLLLLMFICYAPMEHLRTLDKGKFDAVFCVVMAIIVFYALLFDKLN